MIPIISADSALRASGRFIVTTSVRPSSSTRQWGAFAFSGMTGSVVKNENVF